jgi:hypothetical protein
MAEWFKAAVLKTVERKLRGFESYSLRHDVLLRGEMAELAEGARLLSECGVISSTEGSNPSLSASIFFIIIFISNHYEGPNTLASRHLVEP